MRWPIVVFATLLAGMGAAVGQGLDGASGTRSFIWPNGDSFVGAFRNGLPNGPGTMRYADGRSFSGQWVDGCTVSGGQRIAVFTSLKNCPRQRRRAAPLPWPPGW